MTVLTRLRPVDGPDAGTTVAATPGIVGDRYRAFLSYSHRDSKVADWLHQRLESFRVPAQLVGFQTAQGVVPARLRPIFRDRHELAAAGDLGAEIEAALAGSRTLIVLCSPTAAASRWTNAEIQRFHRLRPGRTVLAAIVSGEPFASAIPGREAEECFPPALRVQYDSRGRPTSRRAEPLAADLREGHDGRRVGFLKVVAGLLGVGLDEIVRREAARRQRRMAIITSASIAGMALTSGLAVAAIQARDAAQQQRREAEGLVGFMIGDLRTKLEPMGRLDLLDAVGGRALAYYRQQDKASLSDDSLAQRSRALTMIGEIAAKRGQNDAALQRYDEALIGTAEALRRAPHDPQRLFDHAQSVFWVGSIALNRGRIDEAASRFQEYRELAARMIKADPHNPKWQLEAVYAASNLGEVELTQRRYRQAVITFTSARDVTQAMTRASPGNREYRELHLESLAFLADAYDRSGQIGPAIAQRQQQLAIIAPELARARPDEELRQKAMIANMALGRLLFRRGQTTEGLAHAAAASDIGSQLVAVEPSNADWQGRNASTRLYQATLLMRAGRTAAAAAAASAGCDAFERLTRRDRSVVSWQDGAQRCLALRAELAIANGDEAGALSSARQLLAEVERDHGSAAPPNPFARAEAFKLLGDMSWRSGDRAAARAAWQKALSAWPKTTETPIEWGERGEILRGLGDVVQGQAILQRLQALGYRQSITNRARL